MASISDWGATTLNTDTEHRALPSIGRWRKAGRIQKGWQVLNGEKYDVDGTQEWWTVVRVMQILGPLKVAYLTFDNGLSGGVRAADELFCRTPTEIKRAAR